MSIFQEFSIVLYFLASSKNSALRNQSHVAKTRTASEKTAKLAQQMLIKKFAAVAELAKAPVIEKARAAASAIMATLGNTATNALPNIFWKKKFR